MFYTHFTLNYIGLHSTQKHLVTFEEKNDMPKNIIIILCFIVLNCSWLIGCASGKPPLTKADEQLSADVEIKKISIVQKLKENPHLSVEEQIALYYSLKKDSADVYNFENEQELTLYGYAYLWENKVAEAIEIFRLIVAEFPNSSNAYDSLGEAYLKNGNKELSLHNYEKSLSLDPENFNAEDQAERIKFPDKIRLKPHDKFVKVFSVKEYTDDLDQLGNTLLKVHPNALKFISKKLSRNQLKSRNPLLQLIHLTANLHGIAAK